jgi:hypothetical protein
MRISHMSAVLLVLALPLGAQSPRKLGAPTAALEHEFSTIAGVRELKDGRIVLLDARESAIHLIDLATKTARKVGAVGDGPGEYRLPLSLFALPGDSTAINDMARFRQMLVVTPSGTTAGFVSTVDSALGRQTFSVKATDAAGRFYEMTHVGPFDSSSIVRWDRGRARRDTVARIWGRIVTPIPTRVVGNAPAGTEMRARAAPRPFFTMSQWAVTPDGRVAIVTPEPYRVNYVQPNGARIQGPVINTTPITVTNAEKEAYRAERTRPVASLSMNRNGETSTSYVKPRYEEPDGWPEFLPVFQPDAVSFASDGMLWVKRSTRTGAPPLYDVFDPAAKRAYQLELPAKRKVVGFGNGVVYLARVDDDDLHYLERYALPTTRPIKP